MRRTLPLPRSLFVLATAATLGCSHTSARAPAGGLSAALVDSSLAVATFDSAWTRIHASYYDTTFHGVDWARVRTELRPRAAAARQMDQLRRVLEQMFAPLGESHFAVIPSEVMARFEDDRSAPEGGGGEPGDIGIEVRFVDG